MSFSKILLTFLIIAGVSVFTSCKKTCEDEGCDPGFSCIGGECVADSEPDPCDDITCPEGQSCSNGECSVAKQGDITANETWTANNIYLLNGKVVVRDGVTLTIEPGTIVKGETGTLSLASALVVARGGKIIAEGTADKPIIFTSIEDRIEVGQMIGSNSNADVSGLWGGIIILGEAPVSTADGDTEGQIEGIPADDDYGRYGGSDATDNSGVLRYVSIRHGGVALGEGNEINGLTLGGVGSATVIDHIEVVANADDGIECFGGTVNITNALVYGQGDDGLDIDQNYSGTFDNSMVIQGIDSDAAMEIDGPEGTTNINGEFTITESTFVGAAGDNSKDRGAVLKSGAQGAIFNCVWTGDFDIGARVRADFNFDATANPMCTPKNDAYDKALAGKLTVSNNEFVIPGAVLADLNEVYTDSEDCEVPAEYQTIIDDALMSAGNSVTSTAQLGADKSVFEGWTWTSIKGEL